MWLLMSHVQLANCVEIGLPMLILLVACQVIWTLFYWHRLMIRSLFRIPQETESVFCFFSTEFDARSSCCSCGTREVCFAYLHWVSLGICCRSHCSRFLQQCQSWYSAELSCRPFVSFGICSMVLFKDRDCPIEFISLLEFIWHLKWRLCSI